MTVTSRAPTTGMDAAAAKAAASRDHGGAAWLRLAARAKIAVPAWLMASTSGTTSGARGSTLNAGARARHQHAAGRATGDCLWTPVLRRGAVMRWSASARVLRRGLESKYSAFG